MARVDSSTSTILMAPVFTGDPDNLLSWSGMQRTRQTCRRAEEL